MKKTILAACCLMFTLSSCEDFFEPKLGGKIGDQQFQDNPNIIRGLMTRAYSITMPQNYEGFWGEFLDVATDNAVSNNQVAGMTQMTIIEGKYNNTYNPIDNWKTSYEAIRLVNDFLERGLEPGLLYIRSNEKDNANYIKRIEGEAYFLRAYIQYDLLRRFAGIDTNGELKGVPLLTRTYPVDDPALKTMTRASYDECVAQIIADLDAAQACKGLPHEYTGTDVVYGEDQFGRATTSTIEALRARVLLYAASPAFNLDGDLARYTAAAEAAKVAMDTLAITSLPDLYNPATISADFYNNDSNDEIIYRKLAGNNVGETGVETRNFPAAKGLGGNGRCNPSQNLVDAFPMANGYPITDIANSGYIAEFPAMGRDPRLEMTVYRNGDTCDGVEIQTYNGGNCMIGAVANAGGLIAENGSTRTGYFLRKWVSSKVHIASNPTVADFHYYAPFRKVELFLNFAEAANEAVGPDAAINGLTARQAIREVRRRAGVGGASDPYLASLDQDGLRTLIRNERRIELCFEDHRFFDIRRWKDVDAMKATVYGITYKDANDQVGTVKEVQTPVFEDYMIYGPISNAEIIKCPTITQNAGWE